MLAKWCKGQNMEDVADVHFQRVAQNDANDRETLAVAYRALDLRPFAGRMLPNQEVERLLIMLNDAEQDLNRWSRRIRGGSHRRP